MKRILIAAVFFFSSLSMAAAATAQHGVALHGKPFYSEGFTNFNYALISAPKGGDLRLGAVGTFDTLNPFTLKGVAADGAGMVFETLMVRALDEPFSQYGWIAESIFVPEDKTWVAFRIRKNARFHDGTPITPEDVIFSFETLRDKGAPAYRAYYKDVVKTEVLGSRDVRFIFKDGKNTELPMIVGELPVFPKHAWEGKDFSATTLQPLIGSGPYKIGKMTPGRSIQYVRVKDWWAAELPVNMGRYNFDTITYDYYRDGVVSFQAFLAGRYDFRLENVAKYWASGYYGSWLEKELLVKREVKNELPAGMQAFIFNIRKPMFQDRRVREALNYAFDFEWANKTFAYDAYKRTSSYFENSELAARGLPSVEELKLLQPYRGKEPDELFTKEFKLPKSDGSGEDRGNISMAADLLREAGWTLKGGVLTDSSGRPFVFEIINSDPIFERWVQPFLRNLERLGIRATYRVVDAAQYQNRLNDFSFDMTITVFPQSLSPGNEQFDMWGSAKADVKGSRNLIGIKDPCVDDLLQKIVQAKSRDELVIASRALDRLLLWQYYVIPHWHIGTYRIAYWDKFGQPGIPPKYGLAVVDTWWSDPVRLNYFDEMKKAAKRMQN